MAVDLRQTHFRFGKDDGTEAAHTFWQAEDTNHTQNVDTNWTFLLRFTEQESGGTAAANTDARFQYNKNGAGWVDITTTSSVVLAVAVGAFTDGQACTKRLSGTGTFETSGAGCTEDGLSGGAANDIAASGNSETEAGLQVVAADVANNDTIQFRFTSPDWTVTYTVTPTLTVTKSVTTDRTTTGVGRIQKTVDQTLTGQSRIQGTVEQTTTGVTRVQKTVDQTVVGRSRIQKTVGQTITGAANIATSGVDQTIAGRARVTATTDKTQAGLARIQKTVDQTTSGVGRIQQIVNEAIDGVAKITATTNQINTGKTRITGTTNQTIAGKASINATSSKTVTGRSAISIIVNKTQTGKSSIQKTVQKTITGVAKIVIPLTPLIPEALGGGRSKTLNEGYVVNVKTIDYTPTEPPKWNEGVVFKVVGGVLTIYAWDGTQWVEK